MNKRIRQLAEQAGAVFTDVHAVSLLDDEIEKFAELIVRDIYKYVDGLDTAQIISRGILKRYGVEL